MILYLFIYLFIEGVYSPVNRTGSPQGFSQVQISHKLIQYKTCTLHERKTYKHNPKVSRFAIALVKNGN